MGYASKFGPGNLISYELRGFTRDARIIGASHDERRGANAFEIRCIIQVVENGVRNPLERLFPCPRVS